MAAVSSYALKMDVTEHFERNKFIDKASAEKVKAVLKKLEVPAAKENIKPWYMWTKATKDRQSQFSQEYKPEVVSVKSNNGKVEIKADIDGSAQKALLGFEVLKDGKVIGFTRTNTFTSTEKDDGKEHEYAVRAFDLRSNATAYSDTVKVDLSAPTISVVENTIIPVNSEDFNVESLVAARDVNGEILEHKLVKGTVDLSRVGEYKVTFTAKDAAGKVTNKDVTVHVVSDTTYVSNLDPVSSEVGWKELTKDKGLNNGQLRLLLNGEERVYEKGIAAHANSRVVYDVTGKGYDYFEAFIGIDGAVRNNTNPVPSARFEVWVDGIKEYESSVMGAKTEQEYVKINIKDAKEVVLITDGAGSPHSDHTIWADAKFATSIKSEEAIATENVNEIKAYLEEALDGIDITKIENILVAQPKLNGFTGNETEKLLVSKLEKLLEGKIEGKFNIYFTNYDQNTNIDELLQNNLVIMYQESESKPWYMYQNGSIEKLENE